MADKKTITRIMNVVGINPKQIDLVEKVLGLESDTKRVYSVQLHHGTLEGLNLWADVNLLKNFEDLSEFRKYLASKGLPEEEASKAVDGETYLLINEGMRVEFKKRELYSYN